MEVDPRFPTKLDAVSDENSERGTTVLALRETVSVRAPLASRARKC
jgi:hypothetical protein